MLYHRCVPGRLVLVDRLMAMQWLGTHVAFLSRDRIGWLLVQLETGMRDEMTCICMMIWRAGKA